MESDNHISSRMPVIFLAHGSPMNALANNNYSNLLARLGSSIPSPKAILSISAHWLTEGTFITSSPRPRLIYDMYGFPDELYQVQYPAYGDENLAKKIISSITNAQIQLDQGQWGLDHGTWSLLVHMYPKANIPVLQLSIDISKPPQYHFELGKKLRFLREQGILVLGSGNIVHNLRHLDWKNHQGSFHWSKEFDLWVKEKIKIRDFHALVADYHSTDFGRMSVPSLDHYLPLLYILGASEKKDPIDFIHEGFELGSISQRCVLFGTKNNQAF